MTTDCIHHGAIEERLRNGEKEFGRISEILDTFRDDMKNITNQLGEQTRDLKAFTENMHETYRNELRDIMNAFNSVINGDAKNKIKGYEQRISDLESAQIRIYKIAALAGTAVLSMCVYFGRLFWSKMEAVLTAIEVAQKGLQ